MGEQLDQSAREFMRRTIEPRRGDDSGTQQTWRGEKTGRVYTDKEFDKLIAVARPEDVPSLRRKWRAYSLRVEGRSYRKIGAILGISKATAHIQVRAITARLKTLERWHQMLNDIGMIMPLKTRTEQFSVGTKTPLPVDPQGR